MASSTAEKKYVALGDAVKKLLLLRQMWHFMWPGKDMPCFLVSTDNQIAVQHTTQNPTTNSIPKNVDVSYHCFRELVHQGDSLVTHLPSA